MTTRIGKISQTLRLTHIEIGFQFRVVIMFTRSQAVKASFRAGIIVE